MWHLFSKHFTVLSAILGKSVHDDPHIPWSAIFPLWTVVHLFINLISTQIWGGSLTVCVSLSGRIVVVVLRMPKFSDKSMKKFKQSMMETVKVAQNLKRRERNSSSQKIQLLSLFTQLHGVHDVFSATLFNIISLSFFIE